MTLPFHHRDPFDRLAHRAKAMYEGNADHWSGWGIPIRMEYNASGDLVSEGMGYGGNSAKPPP
ncbi:MAG UNVERIFIED_CONTAM: hypothetical protein LVT10_13185 [Anaerolineae bacterium]